MFCFVSNSVLVHWDPHYSPLKTLVPTNFLIFQTPFHAMTGYRMEDVAD